MEPREISSPPREGTPGAAVPQAPAVTVCGSDMCWQRLSTCESTRAAVTGQRVPACCYVSDRTGFLCLRPEKVHTSGWTHAFEGERAEAPKPPAQPDPAAADAVATVKQAIMDAVAANGGVATAPFSERRPSAFVDAIFAAIFRPEVRWAAVVVGTMPGATTEREEA